jgi:hypothetical protein
MTLSKFKADLLASKPFSALSELAAQFVDLPRAAWGYSQAEIDRARQMIPTLTNGNAGPVIPATLARWYETVGRVRELTASQNRLHPPREINLRDDVVIVYTENQWCAFWGIRIQDLTLADPPVIYTEGKGWHLEAVSISQFALKVGLTELCLSGSRSWCAGYADDTAIGALHVKLDSVPVSPLRWPSPARPARFLADDRVLILMESEFFFAVGLDTCIRDHLCNIATPGRIEWTDCSAT